MAIEDYIKPGYPKLSATENSFVTELEYIGPTTELTTAKPDPNSVWGAYVGLVTASDIEPTENVGYSVMRVSCELLASEGGDSTFGEVAETSEEIEWVVVARSLYEHPEFAIGQGGAHQLASYDITDIKYWIDEPDRELRKEYKYKNVTYETYEAELSAAAKMFARGLELGIETYEDYAPVARRSRTYAGGPPSSSEAGQKQSPTGFPNLPGGYEWRKNSDRSIKAGKRTRWERDEEWLGAIKVLIDKDEIFWTAP